MLLDAIKNSTIFRNKYKTDDRAVIVSCFYNPQRSPYRLKAFELFYQRIRHLNHRIIECAIGNRGGYQLPENANISRTRARTLLWHKETLLANLIERLPDKYEYVFWLDADIIFTNLNWLVAGVKALQEDAIVQPFEYCVHLERDELKPSFDLNRVIGRSEPNRVSNRVWRSFAANYKTNSLWQNENYDLHGHVGFAWGARREILERVRLFDRALIGGADHIMAHAAAGQIDHPCIVKAFTQAQREEIAAWSRKFYSATGGKIGYVPGNLYHLWHGDIKNRQYLKRIREYGDTSDRIVDRDDNGFYTTQEDNSYMEDYYQMRESIEEPACLTPNEDETCQLDRGEIVDSCPSDNFS